MPRRPKPEREHFSMRLAAPLFEGLGKKASQVGEPKSALAERYIGEGLKQDSHPEIVFRDGPFGRRAMLAGTRLEVWQVVETLRNSGNSLEETADYLGLPAPRVRACFAFYAAFTDEVDAYAELVRSANEEAEAAWRREQDLIGA